MPHENGIINVSIGHETNSSFITICIHKMQTHTQHVGTFKNTNYTKLTFCGQISFRKF